MSNYRPCSECATYETCCKNAGWTDAQWDRYYSRQEGKDCFEEKKVDKKLEKAIKILKTTYEKAKKLDYVRKPLAYALYHTWRQIDREEKERNNG